jgi:hypothetical protein
MRCLPFSPMYDRPKAEEWRWFEYSPPIPEISQPGSRLWEAIKRARSIDQGTGSTFVALAARRWSVFVGQVTRAWGIHTSA